MYIVDRKNHNKYKTKQIQGISAGFFSPTTQMQFMTTS